MKAILRGSSGRLGSGQIAPESPAPSSADVEAPVPMTMTFPDGTPADVEKMHEAMQRRLGTWEAEKLPCYSYIPMCLCGDTRAMELTFDGAYYRMQLEERDKGLCCVCCLLLPCQVKIRNDIGYALTAAKLVQPHDVRGTHKNDNMKGKAKWLHEITPTSYNTGTGVRTLLWNKNSNPLTDKFRYEWSEDGTKLTTTTLLTCDDSFDPFMNWTCCDREATTVLRKANVV